MFLCFNFRIVVFFFVCLFSSDNAMLVFYGNFVMHALITSSKLLTGIVLITTIIIGVVNLIIHSIIVITLHTATATLIITVVSIICS